MILRPLNILHAVLVVTAISLSACPAGAAGTEGGYAVVVSNTAFEQADWRKVVDTLVDKHGAVVHQYKTSPAETLAALKKQFPKYACFVAPPSLAGRVIRTMSPSCDYRAPIRPIHFRESKT